MSKSLHSCFMLAVSLLLSFTLHADETLDDLTGSVTERVALSTTVAQVQVLEISDLINRALTMDGVFAVEGFSYEMALVKNWKLSQSDSEPNMDLRIDLKDCSTRLAVGQEYLLFARHNQAFQCDDIIELSLAHSIITELDQIHAYQLVQN